LAPEIETAREEAYEAAAEGEARYNEAVIEAALERDFANVSSARSVITQCDRAVEALANLKRLRPEVLFMAGQAKQRAARYRHDKRIDDAEVAAAGGTKAGLGKAERLRREAAVMLQQDWEQAFPGESMPTPRSEAGVMFRHAENP
jgi:hypothetical protein